MLAGVCFFSAAVGLLNPIVRAADAKSPVVMKTPSAQSSANASRAPGKEVIRGGARYYFVDTVPGGIPVKVPIEGADFITNTNTAIYDGRSIVRDHKASKKGRQELEDYVKAQNDEVQKKAEELSKRKEEFDAVKSSLSTEEAARQEAEIAALHQEYFADLQKRQQDVDAREQAVMKGISEEIKQAAASVAAQKGFKYIQSSFNGHPEKVAGTDITAQVRAKLGDKLETGQGKKSN
jgi:Skp family chaperone for outer membrane proteins